MLRLLLALVLLFPLIGCQEKKEDDCRHHYGRDDRGVRVRVDDGRVRVHVPDDDEDDDVDVHVSW